MSPSKTRQPLTFGPRQFPARIGLPTWVSIGRSMPD